MYGKHKLILGYGANLCVLVYISAQVVLGNGGTVSDDRAEVLRGKMDWISSSLEAAEKKESNEISGHKEHPPPPPTPDSSHGKYSLRPKHGARQ